MKILFLFLLNEPYQNIVNAAATPWKSKLNQRLKIKKIDCVYPTGLLSISAYIQKYFPDAEIRILDCNTVLNQLAEKLQEKLVDCERSVFFEQCVRRLNGFQPDIIGISALFCSNYQDMGDFCRFLKQKFNPRLLICGGHLPSAIFSKIFQDQIPIDAIAFGEGEIPMKDLCFAFRDHNEKDYLAADSAWITSEKLRNNPKFQPERHLIENLDEIPPLDLSILLDPDAYFHSSSYLFVMKESAVHTKEILMFSTRGCPGRCVFCASQNVHGHKVRSYTIDRIKNDILFYNRKYGISRFVFFDDHFLARKKQALEILQFISENNFSADISTPAFFSIDDEVAHAMRQVGIQETNITIESGNAETLRNIIHKPANLHRAEEAVKSLHAAGIIAVSNILIGLPGETPESIEEGIRFLASTDVNWFQCFVAAPLPGSEMYDICIKNDYLDKNADVFSMDFKKCVVHTPMFTPEFIEKKVYEMNLYLNFVNNYDMRTGNYEQALRIFERILQRVLPTHAFAYYFASKCAKKMGLDVKQQEYLDKYFEMIEKYSFWLDWVKHFNLPISKDTAL